MKCPQTECRCDDWPPTECPQCGVQTLGFTPEDWWRHFEEDCNPDGCLYCFTQEPVSSS